MGHASFQKLFGVGPSGAGISLILLIAAIGADRAAGHPQLLSYALPVHMLGALLICAGFLLLLWSISTLRNWWTKDQLCTAGPFRWFRHPMYAAWITFITFGISLYLNSLVLLLWAAFLHPVWHWMVGREEKLMAEHFQDGYRAYAERTGRFIPRLWGR